MKTLIFVYNADSGKFNALKDSLHKLISPTTYDCKLCELTHGFFAEKSQWSDFLKEAKFKAEFLHKNEFISRFESYSTHSLPAVFEMDGTKLRCLLNSCDFKNLNDLSELCVKIKSSL